MPLNRDFIGRSARSKEPFEVTRNDIRRFALAIGDRNPAYLDPEAAKALGHRDVVAPPTFLISASTGDAGGGFIGDPSPGYRRRFRANAESAGFGPEQYRPAIAAAGKMASELDYVPLPDSLIKQVRATWKAQIKGVTVASAGDAKRM